MSIQSAILATGMEVSDRGADRRPAGSVRVRGALVVLAATVAMAVGLAA